MVGRELLEGGVCNGIGMATGGGLHGCGIGGFHQVVA